MSYLAYSRSISNSSEYDASFLIAVENFGYESYERYCFTYTVSYSPNAKVNTSAHCRKISGVGYINVFFGGEKVNNELYLIESIPISSDRGVLPFSIVGVSQRTKNVTLEDMTISFPYYSPAFGSGKINTISGTIGSDNGNGEVSYPIHFEIQESGQTKNLELSGGYSGDISLSGSFAGNMQGTVAGTAGEQVLLGSHEGTGGASGTVGVDGGGKIYIQEYRPYGFIGNSSGSGLGFNNCTIDLSPLVLAPDVDVASIDGYFLDNAYRDDFRGCCTHIETFLPVSVYPITVDIAVYGLNQI